MQTRFPIRTARRGAFTIVEILMALTILALLLTSLAVAFHASMKTYDDNREIAAATQTARSVLNRLADNIRRAAAVDLSTGTNEIHVLCPDTDDGKSREVRFTYVVGSKTLRFREYIDSAVTTDQMLLGEGDDIEVTDFRVLTETGLDDEGLTCAKKIRLSLSFKSGSQSFSMSSSASPRRNQTFSSSSSSVPTS